MKTLKYAFVFLLGMSMMTACTEYTLQNAGEDDPIVKPPPPPPPPPGGTGYIVMPATTVALHA